MTAAECIIDDRKSNEILMLRGFVESTARHVCSQVAWGAYDSAPEICCCYACHAREILATIAVMQDLYAQTK